MKVITYQVLGYTGVWNPETEEVEQKECLAGIERPYTEEAYQKALAEAYNGEVTVEEVAQTEEEIRSQRDRLLADTDWTQVLDAPISAESREAFRVYRQALRDITEQEGFPADVVWPEMPVAVKAAPDPVDSAFDVLIGEEESE